MTSRARGKVYCYEFIRDNVRYTKSGFPSLKVAQDAEAIHRATLTDQRLAREYGIRPPRSRVPMLRTYVEQTYLPSIKGRLAASTYHKHKAILTRMLAHLGPVRVSDVQTSALEGFRDALTETLGANSLRIEWAKVRACFRVAVAAGHLHRSPAAGVGLPRETRGPDRILTEDEQGRLLAAFWVAVHRDMAEFSLWTGLRSGELCGLVGKQVDLEGKRLTLSQPKTQAVKVIPLLPEAVAILRRQVPAGPEDPVFRGAFRGGAVLENVYRRAFKRAVEQAGIPPIRPHDLRHTVAVRLIRAGADLATVGDLLGHKAPYRTTSRYLAHTSEERKREVLSRLRPTIHPQQPPASPAKRRKKSAR